MNDSDLVQVVRCKNCIHFNRQHQYGGYCYHWEYEAGFSPNSVDNDDFCSYGEQIAKENK